jgi:sugar fermentation stimulation protein A
VLKGLATAYNQVVRLPELHKGRLIRRYKRFLADVELSDGQRITAFVPNTGSLLGLNQPGLPVWLAKAANPKRKHPYTLMLVKPGKAYVCVDTGVPNRVIANAARRQQLPALAGYTNYASEVAFCPGTRFDMYLSGHQSAQTPDAWVEIKSVTLVRERKAEFPDAVTTRGRKHLSRLAEAVKSGQRGIQVYFIQRTDCEVFGPADDIDPEYGQQLREVLNLGVEVLAVRAKITKHRITLGRPVPILL